MVPFHTLDYRKALIGLVERQRRLAPKLTYTRIAAAAGIQATYFSNVLKGRAHFNADQLYEVCRFLELSKTESEYCACLLEWDRSRVPRRRQELKDKIEALRRENLRTEKHLTARPIDPSNLSVAEYYLDPLTKIVHVALGISHYAKNVRALAADLGVRTDHLERSLRTLERLGYVECQADGSYACRVRNRHLPEDSPFCLPHQSLLRIRSLEQIQRLPPGRRYGVSVTFSATAEVKERIRGAFLEFLKTAEGLVKGSPEESKEEKVYQLNFDLFPWSTAE